MPKFLVSVFLLLFFLNYCMLGEIIFSNEEIATAIKECSTLEISKNFEVLRDTTMHTETAFDSDYSIQLSLKFDNDESQEIVKKIRAAKNFWKSKPFFQISDSIEIKKAKQIFTEIGKKGLWYKIDEGFCFRNSIIMVSIEDYEPEPITIIFDTLKNELHYSFTHL